MKEPQSKLEDLATGARTYVDLRIDEAKAKASQVLSESIGSVTHALLIVGMMIIVLATFAFGLVLLVGDIIGSYAAGCFIVGGVFAVITLVVFLKRRGMFMKYFRNLFDGLFFPDGNVDTPEGYVLRRKALEDQMTEDIRETKEYYSPSNMIAGFLRKKTGYYNWADLSLTFIRALKERLGGAPAPEEATETTSETEQNNQTTENE